MKMRLERVGYMPKDLEQGVLYVSEEYGTAAHLCPCGCGEKIRTPLGPTEWEFIDDDHGPTLHPSIGNWQHDCQSHYWIHGGQIRWAAAWTPKQIEAGRKQEILRREAHYDRIGRRGFFARLWQRLASLLRLRDYSVHRSDSR